MTESLLAIRRAHIVSAARVFTHNFKELVKTGVTPEQIQALEGMPPRGAYQQMLRDLAWPRSTQSTSLEELFALVEDPSTDVPSPATSTPLVGTASASIRHVIGDPKLVLPAILEVLAQHPDLTTPELHTRLVASGRLTPGDESCASFDAKLKGLRKIHLVEEHQKWRLARKDEVVTALDVIRCIQQTPTFTLDVLRAQPTFRFKFPGMKPGQLKEAYLQSILYQLVKAKLLTRRVTSNGDCFTRNQQFNMSALDNSLNAYTARTPLAASKAKAAEELRKITSTRFWERCEFVYG